MILWCFHYSENAWLQNHGRSRSWGSL
jgi:hypothetical protein